MKPVKNNFPGYFSIGEEVINLKELHTGRITRMVRCESFESCKDVYVNFQVCGGLKRCINDIAVCCFYRCTGPLDKSYLTNSRGGQPLL